MNKEESFSKRGHHEGVEYGREEGSEQSAGEENDAVCGDADTCSGGADTQELKKKKSFVLISPHNNISAVLLPCARTHAHATHQIWGVTQQCCTRFFAQREQRVVRLLAPFCLFACLFVCCVPARNAHMSNACFWTTSYFCGMCALVTLLNDMGARGGSCTVTTNKEIRVYNIQIFLYLWIKVHMVLITSFFYSWITSFLGYYNFLFCTAVVGLLF